MQFFFGKRRKFNRTKEKGSQVGVYPNYWFSTSPTIVGPTTRLQSQPSVFWNKSNNRFESWTEITDPEMERDGKMTMHTGFSRNFAETYYDDIDKKRKKMTWKLIFKSFKQYYKSLFFSSPWGYLGSEEATEAEDGGRDRHTGGLNRGVELGQRARAVRRSNFHFVWKNL